TDGSGFSYLIRTKADERNPVFGQDGRLYYSSDETGIFNIYSYDFKTQSAIRLSNVLGGAFMPALNQNGDIAYAGYTSKGYRIFQLNTSEQNKVDSSKHYIPVNNPPLSADKPKGDMSKFNLSHLTGYQDDKLPDMKAEKYKGAFTKVTFFPVLRYDNYTTSGSFIDKIKPGLYITSSDMLDRYSFFAGAAINRNMERDLFLNFEYRNKLPFLFDLGIRPQLSLEIYNVTREANTQLLINGDTTTTGVEYDIKLPIDVSYSLFEVDLAARHRIFARGNDIELKFLYSNYTSALGSFIYPNSNPPMLYPKTKDTYLIGRNFQFKYIRDEDFPYIDQDINPVGRHVEFQYNYEMNKFNPDGQYTVENGMLKPLYRNFDFNRVELNWKEHISLLKGHTLTAAFRGGTIFGFDFNKRVSLNIRTDSTDFFDFYLGGLIGMRSYPFYAISGKSLAWFNLTYRFPLFKDIDYRFGILYLDKIFLSVNAEIGNAWNESMPGPDKFKKGAGAEIRFKMNSFYMFPTSVFFSASYAFDRADRIIR
ncbi:MAG: biopolymer transporter Tol, partial [Ignavibacteriota bacterium]